MVLFYTCFFFFFFNDTATTEIYPLSLHDALPIYDVRVVRGRLRVAAPDWGRPDHVRRRRERVEPVHVPHASAIPAAPHAVDRKSTRLNSSHVRISYAVFCLTKTDSTLSEATS